MEKILIDVDTNGGNGASIPLIEMLNSLHSKTPHRNVIEAEFEVNGEQLKNVFNYTKWTFNQTVYALNVGEKTEITTSTDIYKCATVERIDDDTFKIYFQGFDVNSEYFK